MKLRIHYDKGMDIPSIWNGIPASEAEDVAEHLAADFNDRGEVVGFTLERASYLLGSVPSVPDELSNTISVWPYHECQRRAVYRHSRESGNPFRAGQ